ncbi:tyrosine-protein kinase family protein [Thermogemmatispora sp.]|uniref:tyrosine-protein kinase family protein n=1 Tax=Thermogemmatispora sp. TaxID=1968838 RepID=UPI001E198D39|nr:hypothetical protein [Thermogemmatispora sp.]MBX5451042.1 hypothetical protein [Thermogemmatispora sp.]
MAEHDRLNSNNKKSSSSHDPDNDTVKLPALHPQTAAVVPSAKAEVQVAEQMKLSQQDAEEHIETISTVQMPDTPVPASRVEPNRAPASASSRQARELLNAQTVRERCRQLCASVFFRERSTIRSLGFTSAIAGEGKTLLALTTASVLASDSGRPVTLLECTWERPRLQALFDLPRRQGLAEWLRGECSEEAIRHRVAPNLTVIPAGDAAGQAMRWVRQLIEGQLVARLSSPEELFILDLPPLVPTGYGALAASLADALILVVHAGVTSDVLVSEACAQLKDLPVQGILLNQIESRIPRWIRQML